jgi:DnaJ-domain-containing protein 1
VVAGARERYGFRDSCCDRSRPYAEGIARSHYDVLGVDPDAGIDEIRVRYRALARDLHPDRRDAAHGARQSAEMAAVNEAWAVLRDPCRRAAYDAHLGTGRPSPAQHRQPAAYGPPNPPPAHAAEPVGCLTSVAGAAPWIALLAVLAVIFVFTAYAGSGRDGDATDGDTTEEAPMLAVRDLRGSCIQQAGGTILVVDCLTVPHEGVIVAQASRGAACPDGTVEWLIRQQGVLACTEPGTEVRRR